MNNPPSIPLIGNIMIVDDTPANLQVLTEILARQGFTVRPVPSGILALQAMRVETPDLVLLDINMPEMNGFEVCQRMKADGGLQEIPVIFLSSLSETQDKLKGFEVGGIDYITKPFQIEEVMARIVTHLKLRRLQNQWEQSERRYRLLTDHMSDLVWSMDPDRNITFLSPCVKQMTGFVQEEIIGAASITLLPEETCQRLSDYLAAFHQVATNGAPGPLEFVSELLRKDGSKFLAEFSVNPMFDEKNHFVGIVGTIRDITERHEAEIKMHQQERALAVLQERERMGRELHDSIGQVLSFVNSQAQVIQEMITQGNAAAATASLAQLSMIANDANTDIREYILNTKTSSTDIGFFDAIHSFLDKFSQMSGIQTILSLPPGMKETWLSPEARIQLLRIIQEALTNTRKYSQARTVQVVFTCSGPSIQAMVMDDGIGFDPERIIDKPGMHFGLDIMRERAAEVGADLHVRSAPGQGVQIIAHFPVVAPKHMALQALKFFLVDDHPLILEGVKNLLGVHGVEVVGTARTGEEAIRLVGTVGPDVVLMDLHLPGMDGVEATRRIKKNYPEIQVIFLTLSTEDRDITRAIQAGANGYLVKNEDPEEFLTLLERLVNGEVVMAPEIMNTILFSISKKQPRATPDEAEATLRAAGLTPQQVDILRDVVMGKEYKQIAIERQISPHTVKYHFGQILDCLKLTSRSEALAYAFQIGLVNGRRLSES